ncbi:E3 ubiquitin-protein ligase listerin [Dendroctonus ponderosae]|nr:E3 ubiquitin-protein ligase listerin [Dendroctonus ponderosae]
MKGKQNRTKNNARPASSGRSAAMLHSTLPHFAGIAATKSTVLPSFAFNPSEDVDASIDSNFQLVLKKVSKKDFTTKLKGLQEFADLLQNAEPSVVKSLLPSWPRFYSVLATHPDNKIREATQHVHRTIVLKAKRDIAPYLKQLMATWYISQYDNYPAAARAAAQAFKETFSPVKFKEAVMVYHQEIFHSIRDNLLVQTAETVSPNQYTANEAATRYERIVTSCLQGYAKYLQEFPVEKTGESSSLSSEIVSHKKFWKLAQSKDRLIKASWFQVLSVLLQRAVHLLAGKEAQTMATILNSLGEEDPMVLPRVWECLLLVMATPDWWKFVNIDQQLTPKILAVLKQGGGGNAGLIYPNFLPLLSNWPPMEENKWKQFLANFLDSMISGLKLRTTVTKSQETTEIAVCYTECLQFLITRNLTNMPLCKFLIKHLSTVLEWCLLTEAVQYKLIFAKVSTLMQNLDKNKDADVMQGLLEYFFIGLFDLFSRLLNSPHAVTVVTKQAELALCLKDNGHEKAEANSKFYTQALQQFVLNILDLYIQYIEKTSLSELFASLCLLIENFGKEPIFQFALMLLKQDASASVHINIYNQWFKKWLQSEEMCCPSLLDLVFLMFEYVTDLEKEIILNYLLEVEHSNCDSWTIARALQGHYLNDPVVRKWLKEDKVSAFFQSTVHEYISAGGNSEKVGTFKQALAASAQGALLISPHALDAIQTEISQALTAGEDTKSLNAACELACCLCEIICTQKYYPRYGHQLLLNLFKVSFNCDDDHPIDKNALSTINSTWVKSLGDLLDGLNRERCEKILEKFLDSLEEYFSSIIASKLRGHFQPLNDRIQMVWDTISQSNIGLTEWLLEFLIEKTARTQSKVITLCKVACFIKGTINSPNENIVDQESISEEEILSYFVNNFMAMAVVPNMQVESNEVLNAIYSLSVCETFLEHFNNIKHYQEILHYHNSSWQMNLDLIRQIHDLVKVRRWDCGLPGIRVGKLNDRSSEASVCSVQTMTTDEFEVIFQEAEFFRKQMTVYENCPLSWEEVHKLIKSVKSCRKLVENPELPQKHWDLAVMALVLSTELSNKSKSSFKTVQYQALLVAVSDLYIAICKKVAKLKETQDNASYAQEWTDLLFVGFHNDLLQLWISLAGNFSKCAEDSLVNLPFLQCFGEVTNWFSHELIMQQENVSYSKLLKMCCETLITNSQIILQLWGHKMLMILVPGLLKIDQESASASTESETVLIFEHFKDKLTETQDIVNSMLMDFSVPENSCKLEPTFDSYTYTFGYMMLWDVIVALCDQASPELRLQYCDWLRKELFLHLFLTNIFKLMSTQDLQQGDAKAALGQTFVTHPLAAPWHFTFFGSETIENFSRYLYKCFLEQFPALVRQWWTGLDNKFSQIVEKITVTHVSPHICNGALNDVLKYQDLFKNLKVKVMPIVREIQAVYMVDEAQMELTITLPANYPLGSPDIGCNRQISGTIQKQLLQFKKCILLQNGKIWDGLVLWHANLDKKFEGIEECYICYSVLHVGTYQFPKLSCRMCKKKFHSACLYKWFNTSRKSTCPICRNLF